MKDDVSLRDRVVDGAHLTRLPGSMAAPVRVQVQDIRSSTVLEDNDLDIVELKDIKFLRHLGNGAYGTVREALLQHTPVAVKILKEGEVVGALGSVANADGQELQDMRKNLVRVRPCSCPQVVADRLLPTDCCPRIIAHASSTGVPCARTVLRSRWPTRPACRCRHAQACAAHPP